MQVRALSMEQHKLELPVFRVVRGDDEHLLVAGQGASHPPLWLASDSIRIFSSYAGGAAWQSYPREDG